MDNSKVIPLPLRSAPGLVYFKIGSKIYPLQLGPRPPEQIERAPAKVLPFRKPEAMLTAATPELDRSPENHHPPDDALPVRHAPRYFPAVD